MWLRGSRGAEWLASACRQMQVARVCGRRHCASAKCPPSFCPRPQSGQGAERCAHPMGRPSGPKLGDEASNKLGIRRHWHLDNPVSALHKELRCKGKSTQPPSQGLIHDLAIASAQLDRLQRGPLLQRGLGLRASQQHALVQASLPRLLQAQRGVGTEVLLGLVLLPQLEDVRCQIVDFLLWPPQSTW